LALSPDSLSKKDAESPADGCKKILIEAQFPDIEIAFQESVFTRSIGPLGDKQMVPDIIIAQVDRFCLDYL
jgi:hypothetical protein